MNQPFHDRQGQGRPFALVEPVPLAQVDVTALLAAVWRGKFLIAAIAALAVLIAGYYAFAIATPRFAATATLKVETTQTQIMDSATGLSGLTTDQTSLNTEIAILQSRHLLAQVVSQLDLLNDPAFNRYLLPERPFALSSLRARLRRYLTGIPPQIPDAAAILEKTIDNLGAVLTVDAQRNTYVFRITATTGDARKSALVANTLAEVYLADQIASKQAATETAAAFLAERAATLQTALEAKESEINALIAENQVDDPAVLDALSRQSLDVATRLQQTQRALDETAQKIAAGTATETLVATRDLQAEQIAALTAFKEGIDNQLAAQSAGLVRLQQLRREAETTRVLYQTFLSRLQQTNIQRGLQTADSRILGLATPGSYVAPRKVLILLMAGLFGLGAGVTLVLARHALRRGFDTAAALSDAIGVPVIAQFPRTGHRRPRRFLDDLNARPTSALAEGINQLRTALLLADPGRIPQVILSTSSVAGEGKTRQAIALAHHLAGIGKSVLLVEANNRQPSFSRFLACRNADLAAVVSGARPLADSIVRDPRMAVDILPGGKMRDSPADLYTGAEFAAFLRRMRDAYDFVILDAPPVLPVPDAPLLAQYCDAVIYAVRCGATDKALVHAGRTALRAVNVEITGLTLTEIPPRDLGRFGKTGLTGGHRAYSYG